MLESFDGYSIRIKSKCKKIKNFLGILILSSFILGIIYMIYWTMISTQEIVYDYTYKFFSPLVLFLFPDAIGFDGYFYSSIALFLASIPLFFGCIVCDKTEDKLLRARQDFLETKKRKEEIQKALEYQKQFDEITQYSICLSIDYLSNSKPVDKILKEKINYVVFEKINKALKKVKCKKDTYLSNVLIITSNDFNCYDWIYDTLLDELAKAKKVIEEKYDFKFIPSLTTEACKEKIPVGKIKKHHFEIQSCNFKNRACSNMLFSKKYNHLNKNKYTGTPIGEYAVFENNATNTYELNVIYKNLSDALKRI